MLIQNRQFLRRFVYYSAVFICCTILGIFSGWKNKPFIETASPNKTYLVELKGDKRRPLLLPNRASVAVLKEGREFLRDVWLHTAWDALDLSFEAGYPNVRWSADNVVEFYRAQYFEDGADLLKVENRTSRAIKVFHVRSVNMFLLFDIQPGSSVILKIPAPRGDWQWIAVAGAFLDGEEIKFQSAQFEKRNRHQQSTYELLITDVGCAIRSANQNH